MKNIKKYMIPLSLILILSGCSGIPAAKIVKMESDQVQQYDTKRADSISPQSNMDTANGGEEQEDSHYDLSKIDIILPSDIKVDKNNKLIYSFMDSKGEAIGWIMAGRYEDGFDFKKDAMPNHSSLVKDEYIDSPLGKCRLYTLDADNGSAASGLTGTHDDYYAVIEIKDKAIYVLEFSRNDKEPKTKEMFIEILKNLSIKQ